MLQHLLLNINMPDYNKCASDKSLKDLFLDYAYACSRKHHKFYKGHDVDPILKTDKDYCMC